MRTASKICLGIGIFLGVAGGVYAFMSGERAGITNLLVTALTLCGLFLVFLRVARQEEEGAEGSIEVHVAPTIWPLGFAVTAVLLALGLIVSPWILILGAAAFAASAGGWLRDVARSQGHAGGS